MLRVTYDGYLDLD